MAGLSWLAISLLSPAVDVAMMPTAPAPRSPALERRLRQRRAEARVRLRILADSSLLSGHHACAVPLVAAAPRASRAPEPSALLEGLKCALSEAIADVASLRGELASVRAQLLVAVEEIAKLRAERTAAGAEPPSASAAPPPTVQSLLELRAENARLVSVLSQSAELRLGADATRLETRVLGQFESEFESFERKVTRLESSRRDSVYTQSAELHLDGAFSAEAAAQLGSQTAQEGEIVIEGYVKDGRGVDIELGDWEYILSDKVTHDLVAWSLSPAELGWLSSCCQGMRVDVERGRRRRRLAVQRRHGKG